MFIYSIENKVNGKRYIGQTILLLCQRWGDHKKALRKGKHPNIYLQRAWNKHGEQNFEFVLLEQCASLEQLNEREVHYMDTVYDSRNPDKGYNIKEGGDNRKQAETTKRRIALAQLGKSYPHQRKGKSNKSLQWIRNIIIAKVPDGYPSIVAPDGKVYQPENVKQFCLEHDLSPNGLRQVMLGNWPHHKGWKLLGSDVSTDKHMNISRAQRPQGWPSLVSPDGATYEIETTLTAFCLEHGLSIGGMSEMINGIKLSYRGWKLLEN